MSGTYKIKKTQKKRATVKRYGMDITNIWPQDKIKPADHFWHYVSKHASQACENVRNNLWHEVAWSLAEIVVWWLSFVNKVTEKPKKPLISNVILYIESNADDILWYKYPNICPNCLGRLLYRNNYYVGDPEEIVVDNKNVKKLLNNLKENNNCTCLTEKKFIESRDDNYKKFVKKNVKKYAKNNIKNKPKSMYKFVEMFKKIYGNNIDVLTIEKIAFHLFEEVGEVDTALTDLRMMDVKNQSKKELLNERKNKVEIFAEELADVFSWSVSLLLIINKYLQCTALFVETFYKEEKLAQDFIQKIIQSTNNLVDLIWLVYENDDGILACEKCKLSPCNENDEIHKGKRGYLSDDMIIDEQLINLILEGSKINDC